MPTINLGKPKKRDTTYNKTAFQVVYQDRRWKRVRKLKFKNDPVCEECAGLDKTSITEDIHHIVPFNINIPSSIELLAFDYDNLISLCIPCHKKAHRDIHHRQT